MNAMQKSMTALARDYLDFRRSLGFQLRREGPLLLKFAEYADQAGHLGPLTTELALRWATLPKDVSPLYLARRLEIVRGFARYCAIFDEAVEVPARGLLGAAHRRTAPHIYSEKEISELMRAAGRLSPPNGLRPRTLQTLFGLLASTGLRVSEALQLQNNDLDWNRQLLVIRKTKFRKSRLVPLHPSVVARLKSYQRFRDKRIPTPISDAFLVSPRGYALKYSTVRSTFCVMCRQLGWESSSGRRRRPRMYDLRHTFVCRRLLQWYRDGLPIDEVISWLSTYLGHVKVTDTYWYLTGTPELLRVASERFEASALAVRKEDPS